MALLFSEGFESTLVTAFWPPAERSGSHGFTNFGRTNNHLSLPSIASGQSENALDNSFLTFRFGPIGEQTGKKLFVGFAARNFKTKIGLSDGTFTTRQKFLSVLDENGATALSFEFKKNLAGETALQLVVLDGADAVLETYVLSSIPAVVSPSPLNNSPTNTMSHLAQDSWFYFEWEFDLGAATPTVKMWVNGSRALGIEDGANQFEVPTLTTISGFQIHGNRYFINRDNFTGTFSTQFDDLYVSDNLPADFNPQTSTALTNRLGAAKVYSNTFAATGARTNNWSIVGGSDFATALATDDGNTQYVASNLLEAHFLTRFSGPNSLLSFERVAAVQMIYSASAAGSLPAALMPIMDDNTTSGVLINLAPAATVFEPDDGYVAKIVTVQTDPITNTTFTVGAVTSGISTNAGRRIGLKVAAVPES